MRCAAGELKMESPKTSAFIAIVMASLLFALGFERYRGVLVGSLFLLGLFLGLSMAVISVIRGLSRFTDRRRR